MIASSEQAKQIARLLHDAFLEIRLRIGRQEYDAANSLAYACHNLPAFQAGSDHFGWGFFHHQFSIYHEAHGKLLFDFLSMLVAIEAGEPLTDAVCFVNAPLSPELQALEKVLRDARMLVARQDNDFMWSSWQDQAAALSEIDALLSDVLSGNPPPRSAFEVLFLPTGPMQEVSLSSGWSQEFLALASRFDVAAEAAFESPA